MEAPAIINRHRRPFLLPVWLSFAGVLALIVAAVVAFFVYRSATTTTVVVLARHAEKVLSSIQDPPMSPQGEQRAQRLAQMIGPRYRLRKYKRRNDRRNDRTVFAQVAETLEQLSSFESVLSAPRPCVDASWTDSGGGHTVRVEGRIDDSNNSLKIDFTVHEEN